MTVSFALLVLRNQGHTVSYTADHRFVVDGQVLHPRRVSRPCRGNNAHLNALLKQ